MGFPAFNFGFKKGDEDWDFGFLTMDLMFVFFLVPEKANNPVQGVALWGAYELQPLARAFLTGKANLNYKQCYLFIDGTDAIARMLLTGDERLKKEIFRVVKSKSGRFNTLAEFESYYLEHASDLLRQVREFCSQEENFMKFYEQLFSRGIDNLTYIAWRKGVTC